MVSCVPHVYYVYYVYMRNALQQYDDIITVDFRRWHVSDVQGISTYNKLSDQLASVHCTYMVT